MDTNILLEDIFSKITFWYDFAVLLQKISTGASSVYVFWCNFIFCRIWASEKKTVAKFSAVSTSIVYGKLPGFFFVFFLQML